MSDIRDFSVKNRLKALRYAISGLTYVFKTQHAMWFHSLTASCVVLLGLYFHVSASDWRWLVLAITLVWGAETMNTAIEIVCDAVSLDHHPLIGKSKDVAAGAVLVAAIGAAIIGGLVFRPYLF
jgi:diacylglycerol kinase (ATP)